MVFKTVIITNTGIWIGSRTNICIDRKGMQGGWYSRFALALPPAQLPSSLCDFEGAYYKIFIHNILGISCPCERMKMYRHHMGSRFKQSPFIPNRQIKWCWVLQLHSCCILGFFKINLIKKRVFWVSEAEMPGVR